MGITFFCKITEYFCAKSVLERRRSLFSLQIKMSDNHKGDLRVRK